MASLGGFFAVRVGGPDQGWHPVGHAARLWSPALACVVLHGIVSDLQGTQRADGGPALRVPRPAGWYADGLPDGPVRALYEQVTGHLSVLADGLPVKIAPRLLDGNSASALAGAAHALLTLRPAVRGPLTDLTTALLDTGRLAGTGALTGPGLAFRRRSRCLYCRAPNGSKCGDCSLASVVPHHPLDEALQVAVGAVADVLEGVQQDHRQDALVRREMGELPGQQVGRTTAAPGPPGACSGRAPVRSVAAPTAPREGADHCTDRCSDALRHEPVVHRGDDRQRQTRRTATARVMRIAVAASLNSLRPPIPWRTTGRDR